MRFEMNSYHNLKCQITSVAIFLGVYISVDTYFLHQHLPKIQRTSGARSGGNLLRSTLKWVAYCAIRFIRFLPKARS